jgi:hypothetical protein
MDDKRDPMNGWPISEVLSSHSSAKEDRYGKLSAYLHSTFSTFLQRFLTTGAHFELLCTNVTELPRSLSKISCDRVGVSILVKL